MSADPDRRLARELGDPQIAARLLHGRRRLVQTPDADLRARHLEAILAQDGARGRDAGTVPARPPLRRAFRHRLGVLAVASSLLLVGTGALAATGVLPPPAQRLIADIAEHATIDLPRPAAQEADANDGHQQGPNPPDAADTPMVSDAPAAPAAQPGRSSTTPTPPGAAQRPDRDQGQTPPTRHDDGPPAPPNRPSEDRGGGPPVELPETSIGTPPAAPGTDRPAQPTAPAPPGPGRSSAPGQDDAPGDPRPPNDGPGPPPGRVP